MVKIKCSEWKKCKFKSTKGETIQISLECTSGIYEYRESNWCLVDQWAWKENGKTNLDQGNLCHECHREWRRGDGEAKTSVERTCQGAFVKFLTGSVEGAVEARNSATRG